MFIFSVFIKLMHQILIVSATIDIKKNIFDLCTDSSDCYLAVVEVRNKIHILISLKL